MKQNNQWKIIAGMVVALGVVAMIIMFLPDKDTSAPTTSADDARSAALASEHAPTIGSADAKVHMVEFLDPACGTCALFYPMVKEWLNQADGELRLSVRHIAFHDGAEYAVRVLEASRNQDKYWETLEALLGSQRQWVNNHVVQPDQVMPAIAGVGLDMDRLMADMNSAEVTQRIEQDKADAILLKVAATPEYYINGRPLPSFGAQQLLDLVREELAK